MKVIVLFPCLQSNNTAETKDYHKLSPSCSSKDNLFTEWSSEWRDYLEKALYQCQLRNSKNKNDSSVDSVEWTPVTIKNYRSVIDSIPSSNQNCDFVVVSLMDGAEKDGWPGLSVVEYLDRSGLAYTGCSSSFFRIDVDKSVSKSHFPLKHTPAYFPLDTDSQLSFEDESHLRAGESVVLHLPLIVKPCFTSGSIGLFDTSIITRQSNLDQIPLSNQFYLEEFIAGREFTCFIHGSAERDPDSIRVLIPVERVFNTKLLQVNQQFLSYDRKWLGWDRKEWWYAPVLERKLARQIQRVTLEVFKHVKGDGYCRMDIRMRGVKPNYSTATMTNGTVEDGSGKLYVIDLNCNCSIDGQDDTALGVMLKNTQLRTYLMGINSKRKHREPSHKKKANGKDAADVEDAQNEMMTLSDLMSGIIDNAISRKQATQNNQIVKTAPTKRVS